MFVYKNWCYVHIPKNSGTNLTKIFLKCKNNEIKFFSNTEQIDFFWKKINTFYGNNFLLENVNYREKQLITRHITIAFLEDLLADDIYKYKIFTTVRNPYTRLVSCYQNLLRLSLEYNFGFDQITLPFPIFVKEKKFTVFNEMPQIAYLKNLEGKVCLNKFYKMETDLEQLESDFGVKHINTFKYNNFNYNKNYHEIYDNETISIVQKTFKDDFEYFGYDISPFWIK